MFCLVSGWKESDNDNKCLVKTGKITSHPNPDNPYWPKNNPDKTYWPKHDLDDKLLTQQWPRQYLRSQNDSDDSYKHDADQDNTYSPKNDPEQ